MFFVATRAGASKEDILGEAQRYLLEVRGIPVNAAEEQLNRVTSFLRRYALTYEAKQAWLVFWNRSDSLVINATSDLVQALDPRISERRIYEFLEFYYRAVEYTPCELLYYATRPSKNPYRAEVNKPSDRQPLSYTCGHDPWLEARYCRQVRIWNIEGGGTKVCWDMNDLSSKGQDRG